MRSPLGDRMMQRRAFLAGLGSVLAGPLAATAQQPAGKVPHVGLLGRGETPFVTVFRQRLRDRGYAEGRNVTITHRWDEGNDERRLTDSGRRPGASEGRRDRRIYNSRPAKPAKPRLRPLPWSSSLDIPAIFGLSSAPYAPCFKPYRVPLGRRRYPRKATAAPQGDGADRDACSAPHATGVGVA